LVSLVRLNRGILRISHHFGFVRAIWYWHFVDVVWLFLFCWIYVWGAWI
jgi:cytochrome c oxidase subunit 3